MKNEAGRYLTFGEFRVIDNGDIRPTKRFYDRDPRSKRIRELCVAITRNLARLLWDTALTNEDKNEIKSSSEETGKELVELGVTERAHGGKSPQAYLTDSMVMAEYVAGQLLPYAGYSPKSKRDVAPIISELNLTNDNEHYAIRIDQTPQTLEQFTVDGWIVGNAIDYLDCYEEVRFKYEDGLFKGQ